MNAPAAEEWETALSVAGLDSACSPGDLLAFALQVAEVEGFFGRVRANTLETYVEANSQSDTENGNPSEAHVYIHGKGIVECLVLVAVKPDDLATTAAVARGCDLNGDRSISTAGLYRGAGCLVLCEFFPTITVPTCGAFNVFDVSPVHVSSSASDPSWTVTAPLPSAFGSPWGGGVCSFVGFP